MNKLENNKDLTLIQNWLFEIPVIIKLVNFNKNTGNYKYQIIRNNYKNFEYKDYDKKYIKWALKNKKYIYLKELLTDAAYEDMNLYSLYSGTMFITVSEYEQLANYDIEFNGIQADHQL